MRTTLMLLAAALLAACGQQGNDDAETATPSTQAAPVVTESIYATAVQNESRPEADRARDAGRKPAEVLEFLGIGRDMTVLDLFSGGGYYSEIMAAVVGPGGKVIAQTNETYLQYVGDEFRDRYANDRLPNVEILMAENNELTIEAGSLDAVMMVLTYHDLFSDNPDQGWPLFDVPALLAELRQGLKPGGIVGIIDHYAAAGTPRESGNTVHRIDPAIVVAGMEAAGFVLEEQSDILRNPDDDYSKTVFDPELRGKTDRFVMRFRVAE